MTRRRLAVLLMAVLSVMAACGGNSERDSAAGTSSEESGKSADALPITVTAEDFKFKPDALEGHATHTIGLTFSNEDDTAHSFTIDELDIDVEAEGGQEAQSTFTPEKRGTFEYYCKYHPDTMKGKLEVS